MDEDRYIENAGIEVDEVLLHEISSIGKGCIFWRKKTGNPIMIPIGVIKAIDTSKKDGSTMVITENGNVIVDETFDETTRKFNEVGKRSPSLQTDVGCVFHRAETGAPIMIPSSNVASIDISYSTGTPAVCTTNRKVYSIRERFEEAVRIFCQATK